MDGRAWRATVHGVTRSRTQLTNTYTHTHTHTRLITIHLQNVFIITDDTVSTQLPASPSLGLQQSPFHFLSLRM